MRCSRWAVLRTAVTVAFFAVPLAGSAAPAQPLAVPAQEQALVRRQAGQEAQLERGIYYPTMYLGPAHQKMVALTFDDGPHPQWTPQLLDLLKSLNVRATFFVVGKMVDKYPELAAREMADGHELANHTYDHLHLKQLSEPEVTRQLQEGAAAIKRVTGFTPMFFRPPGGGLNATTVRAAAALRFTAVMWTANSKDFSHPAPAVLEQRLLAGARPGAILLCHDGIGETLQILPDLVARLRAEGYTFVTVSELARERKAEELSGRTASHKTGRVG